MRFLLLLLGCITVLCTTCKRPKSEIALPTPAMKAYGNDTISLSKEAQHDKILGALVGSAIGDAMAAATEMWHRKAIQLNYGYITGLTPAVRERSPEGTWAHNLNAGATTDDTRWKYLMVKYMTAHKRDMGAAEFAAFIVAYYTALTHELQKVAIDSSPDTIDVHIEKINWIKEWARVALAYQKSATEFEKAKNRFYGGEMSCAGQLYTPMFGLINSTPNEAYRQAYEHTLFDLGYAKDISALVAAMTQMAMQTQNLDSILNVVRFVDPLRYQDSRLVGRIAYATADDAMKSVLAIKDMVLIDSLIAKDSLRNKVPAGFHGTRKEWVRQEKAYQMLEKDEKAIAFHAGEIWQILITALQFGEGDFEKTMQFIVNYGRDNDTVAAIAGLILGAKEGYSGLPKELREQVLEVNKAQLGIDLEMLATELVSLR